MFGKELHIKKYPYLGFSPNIMEYFSIIGYQENFIPILIESFKKRKNPYSPTTLSSITSSIDYGIVDNELIISQVYPDNPLIIPIYKNENANSNNNINTESPPTSNVIYSFCFDTTDGKSKLFYTCFAFKFYEKYIYKNNSVVEEYYIPKAFCIVSQYSFFTLFEYICKNVYILMNKKTNNMLPVELILYNIVNYIPSPMSYNLHLDIFSFCMNVEDIEINQLSGYPYIDFDLKEIFNILPLNFFLEIYILTLIEQSMLFFSSNLELLNIVMFIMYILNYPCNDSTYFWHIVSVSKNNLVEENKFVGKIMVSLLGVNATYDDSIDTFSFGRYHYIVDIDNKKLFLRESLDLSLDEKEDVDRLNNLHQYIQNIIKEKNIESSFLKPFIIKLKKNMDALLLKEQEQNPNPKVKNININFFKMSKSIYSTNRKIQETFYDFCLNILMIFYQDNTLVSSFDKIKRVVDCKLDEQNKKINYLKINDTNVEMSNEEKYFLDFFRGTIKYKIYFENFIQNMDTVDVFKIALLFSEEFINIKMRDPKNKTLNKLSLFNIIDTLYYPSKQRTINITINNLFSLYTDKLKKYFEEYCGKIKGNSKNQLININKKIINKYLFLLNNFYEKEEIIDLFPSIRIQEEQPIIFFDRRYIINIIHSSFENNNLIDTKNYLIYGVIYIFCISIPLYSFNKLSIHLESVIHSLEKIKFFLRQYGYIILQTLFKYLCLNKEKNIYRDLTVTNIKIYYFQIVSMLKQYNIIPNEEMMAIFTKFFGQMIYQERNSLNNKREKEIDDSETNFELTKNVNFLCFMKHCFSKKKYYNSSFMIKSALNEFNNSNIIIQTKNLILKPTVEIKIKDYKYSTDFFTPKKIFKLTEVSFNDYYENQNMDYSKLKIKHIRDCIANLILYGHEVKEIPIKFLIYTLYLLRHYEEKYIQKESKIENKNENEIYETIDNNEN